MIGRVFIKGKPTIIKDKRQNVKTYSQMKEQETTLVQCKTCILLPCKSLSLFRNGNPTSYVKNLSKYIGEVFTNLQITLHALFWG